MAKKLSLLGVNISLVTNKTIIPEIERTLSKKPQVHIVTPNPEQIIQAQGESEFKKNLNNADIAIPDGVGVIWALKRRHKKIVVERVTGADLLVRLCEYAQVNDWKVGLLGGWDGVAQAAGQRLKNFFPKLRIVTLPAHQDVTSPTSEEDVVIAEVIRKNRIEILFVAYGAPYQELWIAKYLPKLKTVKIAMGIGGAFDFLAGYSRRAPLFLQNAGFEWLYRLVRQPWRWKRQLRLASFVWRVMREK